MALTRAFLRGLKLDEEQVSAIIEAHTETVDGLKATINDTNKTLADAEKALENERKNGWAEKYETLNKEYEEFKADTTKKAEIQAKEKAYIELLRNAGVSEKRIDGIIKYEHSIIESEELDEDGKFKSAKDMVEKIKTEWADFITTSGTKGANVAEPPAGSNPSFDGLSLTAKMAYANEHPESPEVKNWLSK